MLGQSVFALCRLTHSWTKSAAWFCDGETVDSADGRLTAARKDGGFTATDDMCASTFCMPEEDTMFGCQ